MLPTHWFTYQRQARSQGAASGSTINLADPSKNSQNFRPTCSSASRTARHATAVTCRYYWPKHLEYNPRSQFHFEGWPSKRGVRRNDDVTRRQSSLLSVCSMCLSFAWSQCSITVDECILQLLDMEVLKYTGVFCSRSSPANCVMCLIPEEVMVWWRRIQ